MANWENIETEELFDKIYNIIIEKLENNIIPWRESWTIDPTNLFSNRHYNGINIFFLNLSGYESPYWLTENQIVKLKGNIKKGETPTPIILYFELKNQNFEIEDNLIEQMRRFEQETKYKAIWKGKITGMFIYYKYIEDHPEYVEVKEKAKAERVEKMRKGKQVKKESKIEEIEEEQVVDEENLLLDCVEDYKKEFNVKSVNSNSQKFKRYFYKWKQEN